MNDPWPVSKIASLYAPKLDDELARIIPPIAQELGLDPGPILRQLCRSKATASFVAALLQIQAAVKKRGRPWLPPQRERVADKVATLRAQGLSGGPLFKRAQEELYREDVFGNGRSPRKLSIKQIRETDKLFRSLRGDAL